MKIFYINGYAQAGKDTFVDMVSTRCKCACHSTIDTVKSVCFEHFAWDGKKDEKGRNLLAAVKAAWLAYNNGPVVEVGDVIEKYNALATKHSGIDILFVMVREIDQIKEMIQLYGGETLYVIRSGVQYVELENMFSNAGAGFAYDHIIVNDGSLLDLEKKAAQFVADCV